MMHLFRSGITQNVSFFCSMSDRRCDKETCVDDSGHEW